MLRDGDAQYAVVEFIDSDGPLFQLLASDMGGELDAVQVGETALPAGEGGRPIGTIRNLRMIFHFCLLNLCGYFLHGHLGKFQCLGDMLPGGYGRHCDHASRCEEKPMVQRCQVELANRLLVFADE